MLERLVERGSRIAEAAARRHAAAVADRIRAVAPSDVEVESMSTGARLSGRGLKRRIALDPVLRSLGALLK